jgi:hypothetical protein
VGDERRSLRTRTVEVLADVAGMRLDGGPWIGLGPDDLPLAVEDQSTSDLCASSRCASP